MSGLSRYWKIEIAAVLSAVAVFVSSTAYASVVETWTGNDAFNDTSNSITFTGITADQLTLITGDGTYEASTSGGNPVSTTFTLSVDLNNSWTTILTWTTSNTSEQLLSGLSTPINFSLGTVTGIELTATPAGSFFDPTFDNFNFFDDDRHIREAFTFNDVAATPIPGAAVLFGTVLFGGLGVSNWRKRRRGRSTVSVLA